MKFIVDTFDNVVPYFLDIEAGLSIYYKNTNTEQYNHYNNYYPLRYKTSWIYSPVHQAVNICDKNKLEAELTKIKDRIAWNGFPKRIGLAKINNKLKGLNVNTELTMTLRQ